MSDEEAEQRFIQSLMSLRADGAVNADATMALREAIVRLGSETSDNVDCAERVEVGTVRYECGPQEVRGVRLADRSLLVVDVLRAAEDGGIPTAVSEAYPVLSEAEWQACLRLSVLVWTLFERKKW